MFGMTKNANMSLIFPEIALNHYSPNVNSPPHRTIFCNQIFIRHKSQCERAHGRWVGVTHVTGGSS